MWNIYGDLMAEKLNKINTRVSQLDEINHRCGFNVPLALSAHTCIHFIYYYIYLLCGEQMSRKQGKYLKILYYIWYMYMLN